MGTRNRGRKARDGRKIPSKEVVDALLENPLRRGIMDLLGHRPGMNKQQLAQELGVNGNAVEFHLRRLERYGMVVFRAAAHKGRETLCFTWENVDLWEDEATRLLFGRGLPRQVAMFLAQNPNASVSDVAKGLGMSPHTVRRHVKLLEEHDLVEGIRIHRDVLYHAAPPLRSWVAAFGELCEGELPPGNR